MQGKREKSHTLSLFNFTMPFIRYAIGDIGVPSDDKCSCGRSLPLMKMIEGRKDSFLTLPGNRILSPMVFNFAVSRFKYYTDIDQYRIHQKKINYFDVYLKMNHFPKEQTSLALEFDNHLKEFLNISGNEVEFNISFVEDIPLSKTGKLMSVWSDLKI